MRLFAWICLLAGCLIVNVSEAQDYNDYIGDYNRPQCRRGCEVFNYHGFSACVYATFLRRYAPWMRHVIDMHTNHAIDLFSRYGGIC